MLYNFKKNGYVKARDAWFTVIVIDLFAIPLSLFISKYVRKITPDHLTFLSLFTFVISIFLLFQGETYLAFAGMLTSTVFDCVDGKLARLSNIKTSYGALLDALCDGLVHTFGFLSIAIWFYVSNEYETACLILLWCVYFGIMHISSIHKTINRNQTTPTLDEDKSGWDAFTNRYRLEKMPLSDVEVAFLFIPLTVIMPQNAFYLLSIVTLIFVLERALRLVK